MTIKNNALGIFFKGVNNWELERKSGFHYVGNNHVILCLNQRKVVKSLSNQQKMAWDGFVAKILMFLLMKETRKLQMCKRKKKFHWRCNLGKVRPSTVFNLSAS